MAPKETNQEATLRMIEKGSSHQKGRGYDGKGKGKGGKDKGPPSSEQLPLERRQELSSRLDAFVSSEEVQLQMPSSINGLERKYLHEQADVRGLTTQSFGQGRDRYICIFKEQAQSSGTAATEARAVENVQYSAVFLDDESQTKLTEFCRRRIPGGIPSRWKTHGDHMTICLGPLLEAKTEDHRSVADTVQQQIARYQDGQRFELKVVSIGHDDNAIAVGVIGCVSCNRNPHITVATAPGQAPNSSNFIKKWTMLAAEDQLVLTGQVMQLARGSSATEPKAEPKKPQEDWDGKLFKLGCLVDHQSDLQWFGLGENPDEMGAEEDPTAVRVGCSKEDATRFRFKRVGTTRGGETVNPGTLSPGVTISAPVPVYTFHAEPGHFINAIDHGPGPEYYCNCTGPCNADFAFLPLERGSRTPVASGKPDSEDCFYGMYHVEPREDAFVFWHNGEYPVYLVGEQLCRASDECEPPTRYKVEFIPEHFKIVELDITEGEQLSVLCRGVGGAELAHLRLPPSAAFTELERQLREAMPPLGLDVALSLVNAKTGKLLKPSASTDSVMKVITA